MTVRDEGHSDLCSDALVENQRRRFSTHIAQEDTLTDQGFSESRILLLAMTGVAVLLASALCGCNQRVQYPDAKAAIDNAMSRNDLVTVNVSQDREVGILTLTGTVESAGQKAEAEGFAAQASPGYTIFNEIEIRAVNQATPVAFDLRDGAEGNFQAALRGYQTLDYQSITYDAKDGTLVLKGNVKPGAKKPEAGIRARAVPNVTEVINEIEVKPGRDSTPN